MSIAEVNETAVTPNAPAICANLSTGPRPFFEIIKYPAASKLPAREVMTGMIAAVMAYCRTVGAGEEIGAWCLVLLTCFMNERYCCCTEDASVWPVLLEADEPWWT
jgi:hypothetical protein